MKEFFLHIYETFIHFSWVEWTINFCKNNAVMAGIIGGAILFILVVLCVMGGVSRRAKKAAKLAAKAPVEAPQSASQESPSAPVVEEQTTPVEVPKEEPQPVATQTVEELAPVQEAEEIAPVPVVEAEEEIAEPAVEESPAEEVAEEATLNEEVEEAAVPTQEEVVEKLPEMEEATEVIEEIAVEEKVKEIKMKKEKKPTTPTTEIGETIALIENMDESTPSFLRDHYEEGEMDKIARYTGKWSICRVLTDAENSEEMYFFELRASNGEKLLSSEEYTTYQGALRGIETHRANILNGNIKMSITKKGDYIFKVLSGKNMLLCLGQNYPTMVRCQKAITSTKRFAETAILDENVQDIVIKVPQEENAPLPTFPEGSIGKWIIFSKELPGGTIYYFELFANNGERLLSSESYTTYIGAINGIQTYKNNIQKDNFRITLTKRGDYIYKLLNANNQLLCLGEHYKTKRLCENAVESVKRFALSSPVLTEEKK